LADRAIAASGNCLGSFAQQNSILNTACGVETPTAGGVCSFKNCPCKTGEVFAECFLSCMQGQYKSGAKKDALFTH
jgi:hypothetical protein